MVDRSTAVLAIHHHYVHQGVMDLDDVHWGVRARFRNPDWTELLAGGSRSLTFSYSILGIEPLNASYHVR